MDVGCVTVYVEFGGWMGVWVWVAGYELVLIGLMGGWVLGVYLVCMGG